MSGDVMKSEKRRLSFSVTMIITMATYRTCDRYGCFTSHTRILSESSSPICPRPRFTAEGAEAEVTRCCRSELGLGLYDIPSSPFLHCTVFLSDFEKGDF